MGDAEERVGGKKKFNSASTVESGEGRYQFIAAGVRGVTLDGSSNKIHWTSTMTFFV